MIIIGYIASLLIGVSLGLIGGGGSILTVPILVYLFDVDPVIATAYSLFIVGTTSLAGVFPKYKEGLVDIKTAAIFGTPTIIAVFLTRKYILPAIPQELFAVGDFVFTKAILLMVLFAILMVLASISMIRGEQKQKPENSNTGQVLNYPLIFIEGIIVGILTGLVGAGGGFLIIPALVILSKLPIKQAVGTSLLIIAANSLIGFTGDLGNFTINWELILTLTGLAISGIVLGNWMSRKVDGAKLKKGFGWFVLVMGAYILISELFFPKIK